jgi:ATP-dependent Clp protease ATP-binding subunit ClpC
MTSNLGTKHIRKSNFGFGQDDDEIDYKTMKSSMMEETKRLFTPEFLNRIDELVVFRPLKRSHILQVIDIAMEDMLEVVKERHIQVSLTPKAREFLADKGFDAMYGARQVKRTLRKYVEDPIAEEMLKGRFSDGSRILIRFRGDELEFAEDTSDKTTTTKMTKPRKLKKQKSVKE